MLEEGKRTFRFDTFGSEDFWGGKLRLHEAIAGQKLGGVGPGVSPKTALSLGLKVDAQVLPAALVAQIRAGKVDLDDPATTAALLKLNAVVGVTGFFNPDGKLRSVGIQCALCHSTVDDSFSPGIGKRLDGWGNRDLNIGAIVATAPNLQPFSDLLGVDIATVKKVLNSWGPGRYDAELNVDGKAMRPDGKSAATMMPSAFGLAGVNQHTWTGGWGTVTYWNAYVANTQMHGKGTFLDSRLDNAQQYPVAAKAGWGRKRDNPDLITAKLPALHFYQLAMPSPKAPTRSFNAEAARRGQVLFTGTARCSSCHVPPIFTEPGYNLHKGEEIGIDDFQANRGPERRYVTTPLRALFDMQKLHKGGFYHDGRFATLADVVDHYNGFFKLGLSAQQKSDLIEYLKSL
jgi:cytochrome c peroxidase